MDIHLTSTHGKNTVISIPESNECELFDRFYKKIADSVREYAASDVFPSFAKYICDAKIKRDDSTDTVTLHLKLKVRGRTVHERVYRQVWKNGVITDTDAQTQKKKKSLRKA